MKKLALTGTLLAALCTTGAAIAQNKINIAWGGSNPGE